MKWLKRMPAGQVLLFAGSLSLLVFVIWVGMLTFIWSRMEPGGSLADWGGILEGVSSAAAFATVIGGGVVVLIQLVETVESRHLSVYNDIFKDMMSDEEIEARRWIYLELPDDPEQGMSALDPLGQRHVKRVLNSFDHLGFLLRQGWVSEDALIEWVSPIVVKTWIKIGPYVEYECRRRGEPYYYDAAQYLARRCAVWWARNRPDSEITWIRNAL